MSNPIDEKGRHDIPHTYSAIQVGAASSVLGAAYGGVKATLRYAKRPAIAAISQGIEGGLLGIGVWKIREFYLASRTPSDRALPSTQVAASTIAGGAAFPIVTYFTRGSVLLLPFRSAFGAAVGYGLQHAIDSIEDSKAAKARSTTVAAAAAAGTFSTSGAAPEPRETALQRFAKSKFSPFSILSDAEYSRMLKEKMLVVDADIAVIDESIAKLRGDTRPEFAPLQQEAAVVDASESRERLARRREG